MHKTKPIAKDLHSNRKGENARERNCHHDGMESVPYLQDLPVMGVYDNNYLFTDFMQSLQMEQPPYYLYNCLDPYFDPYYDSDYSDPTTAPARTRILIERINQQYLEKIGELVKGPNQFTMKINNEIRIKYYVENDAASSIGEYEEHIEVIEEQRGMEQQASQ